MAENEGAPLLVLSLAACLLTSALMVALTNFLYYLHQVGPDELRDLVEPWREFLLNIFLYSYIFFLGLLFFGIFLSLVVFLLDLIGIVVASIWGLTRGFITELFYWIDRLKKLLKRDAKHSNNRL